MEDSETEKKDIASSTEIYPVIISNPIFRNLHKHLIQTIEAYMKNCPKNRSLLILGLSPVASPYGDNEKFFMNIVGDSGKVIALDYNLKIIAKALTYLSDKSYLIKANIKPRLFLDSYRSVDVLLKNGLELFLQQHTLNVHEIAHISKEVIDPNNLNDRTFLAIERNLNFGLNIADNSIDCVDATLTLHHVAAYKQQFKKVLKEIFRVLKPGGMLYYGDVFVDMRGSEAKINKIMNEMTKLNKKTTIMFDNRDAEWKVCAEYKYRKKYPAVPKLTVVSNPPKNKPIIEITPNGSIIIPIIGELTKYLDKLNELGYFSKQLTKHFIEIPLIDPAVEKDHVRNVNEFQDLVKELKVGLFCTTHYKKEEINKAIERGLKEKENALKGLFEYMSPRDFIIRILREVGFHRIESIIPVGNIKYPSDIGAIVAYKSKN